MKRDTIILVIICALFAISVIGWDVLRRKSADRWTGTDMREWCKEFQSLNPEIKMPQMRGKDD